VEVQGEALTSLDQAGDDDPALGAPAPTLVGQTPAGEPITIDPASEGPMLIAFVAHWCPHCQAEVPRIVELFGGQAELDAVELVAVSTGANTAAENYPPGEWLASEGWPGRTLVDDEQQTAFATYGGGSYPYLVAIDADGNVVARESGEQGEDGLQALVDAAAGTSG
jgi:thiol-disulfide isomerase/thioredoxin